MPSCFPRATRGWKGTGSVLATSFGVSPALRGDGRLSRTDLRRPRLFPPRYAGMEESISASIKNAGSFPRATRGWKGEPAFEAEVTHVSPALRGDGRTGGT